MKKTFREKYPDLVKNIAKLEALKWTLDIIEINKAISAVNKEFHKISFTDKLENDIKNISETLKEAEKNWLYMDDLWLETFDTLIEKIDQYEAFDEAIIEAFTQEEEICELCWEIHETYDNDNEDDLIVEININEKELSPEEYLEILLKNKWKTILFDDILEELINDTVVIRI